MTAHGCLHLPDRSAFFAYAGRVMRSVVIDQVRALQAEKRGGDTTVLRLATGLESDSCDDRQVRAMMAALKKLERTAPEHRALIELRYFAGMSLREVAELRGTSLRTVERHWQKTRALLRELMRDDSTDPA
jgi:RNA polymerase sigma factor (TIGR02999 family)